MHALTEDLPFQKMSVILTDMEHMSPTQQKTMQKLVEAAIELMSARGFHRVSVQEIGEKAGLCEKTVFRYFPTKTDLLTAIIRYRAYASKLREEFQRKRTWHLDHDLPLVVRLYFQSTKAKRNVFRAYLSALDSIDTNGDDFQQDPRELLKFLTEYLEEMQKRGRVKSGEPQLMAKAFVNTLSGYILMYCMNDHEDYWQSKVESIKYMTRLFIRELSGEMDRDGNTRGNPAHV